MDFTIKTMFKLLHPQLNIRDRASVSAEEKDLPQGFKLDSAPLKK